MENCMLPLHDEWENNCRVESEARGGQPTLTLERAGREMIAVSVHEGAAPGTEMMARLLLIEDDEETADEIRAELSDRGFDVDWAATGIEGLDKARSGE